MSLHFGCTQCGKCCHGLRLILSVDEAIVWAGRGHTVQLLAEAIPWPPSPDSDPVRALHDAARSFPAVSHGSAFRIAAVLTAYHEGACPHLMPDMRCGNYEARPRICRIYPLDSKPFTQISPERRLCPPEAWAPGRPLLMRGEKIANDEAAEIVETHRRTMIADVPTIGLACDLLGISDAAFANEGLAVHTPAPQALVRALLCAKEMVPNPADLRDWTILTNRRSTLSLLSEAECDARLVKNGSNYLGSFSDEG